MNQKLTLLLVRDVEQELSLSALESNLAAQGSGISVVLKSAPNCEIGLSNCLHEEIDLVILASDQSQSSKTAHRFMDLGLPVVLMASVVTDALRVQALKAGLQEVLSLEAAGTEQGAERLVNSALRSVYARQFHEQSRESDFRSQQKANEKLKRFTSIAAHDLKAPLRQVGSFAQLLQRKYADRLDEKGSGWIDQILGGVTRMQSLIDALLSYSRMETNPFEEFSLEGVIEEVLRDLALEIRESGGQVRYQNLPVVWGDRIQFVQLFQNLIGNSLKYWEDEPPQVEISGESEGSNWVISVEDQGLGIEEQYFKRIFSFFERLHGRAAFPGHGLGLAISRHIVKNHGGRIWLKSKIGEGTTFFVEMPKKPEERVPSSINPGRSAAEPNSH